MVFLLFAVGLVVLFVWFKHAQREARIKHLMGKYSDPEIVGRIMKGQVWAGQTAAQLADARGLPVAKDDRLLKTIKREVWKYQQTGKNRYGLRITLDNDVVTAWDQKQ